MTTRIKKSLYPEILTTNQEQILTGLLLGDAYLRRDVKRNANTFLSITRTLSDKYYNLWLSEQFSNMLTPKSMSESSIFDKRTKEIYHRSIFRTKSCVVLNDYHSAWYSSGNKCVPHNLFLTPTTIAIWFCDDGCVIKRPYNKLSIRFATNGYQKHDVELLASLLTTRYNSNFHLSKAENNQYVIDGADACVRSLTNDISKVFPQGMERKIKW
jgi:hypothetical protein